VSAPILARSLRGAVMLSGEHPFIRLYDTGLAEARRQGCAVVYGLPDRMWLRFLRAAPERVRSMPHFRVTEFGCVGRSIARAARATRQLVVKVASFGGEYMDLWQSARDSFPIDWGIVRHPDWLRYRNGGRIAVELRDARDTLIGFAAVKKSTGLLMDVLTRTPDDLGPVIEATIDWLARERVGEQCGWSSLKAMAIPALAPHLGALGFTHVDHGFGFLCDSLDGATFTEGIAPDRWYVTPGD
jgi:hypothetical protein